MHHDCDFRNENKTKAIDHASQGGGHDVAEITEEDGNVTCRMLEPGGGLAVEENAGEDLVYEDEETEMTDKEERE